MTVGVNKIAELFWDLRSKICFYLFFHSISRVYNFSGFSNWRLFAVWMFVHCFKIVQNFVGNRGKLNSWILEWIWLDLSSKSEDLSLADLSLAISFKASCLADQLHHTKSRFIIGQSRVNWAEIVWQKACLLLFFCTIWIEWGRKAFASRNSKVSKRFAHFFYLLT
jgi:hypothetical protein